MDDYFWLIVSALLVFMMQAGFLCLESGRIRSKNSINVAAKNIFDFVISVVIFWTFGFALMFGQSMFGLVGVSEFVFDSASSPWNISFFLFQLMFCGTATTIVSGAVSERMSFKGYLLAAAILSGFIYPIVGHWAWASAFNPGNIGWLEQLGFVDFAGSMIVHGVGGCVALVAVIIIGPRIGRFQKNITLPQGSNLPLSALGTLLLWFGWFGFNGGSSLIFNQQVPVVLLNTCISAAWGGICASAIYYSYHKFVDVTVLLNGIIGGLVGITAGCHALTSLEAMFVGIISGMIIVFGESWMEKLKIDDALGVVPAHLFAGIWGVLAVGLFGDLDILATGNTRSEQVLAQVIGIGSIVFWSVSISYVLLSILNKFVPLRVSKQAEEDGLNVSEHNAATELKDLLVSMAKQKEKGDFSDLVPEHSFTEVGLVAREYNQVIQKVQTEISARDGAIRNFQSSERRKSAILDSSMDCIVTLDIKGRILEFNPAAERTFDTSKQRVKNSQFIDLFVPIDARLYVENSLKDGFANSEGLLLNRRNRLNLMRYNGAVFPAEISITFSHLINNTLGEYVLNIRDVTRQTKLEDRLKNLAYSDSLTGLYNRAYLIDNMTKALREITLQDETVAIFFLDLDKFKRINDTLGHKAGDLLLCEVANRLTTVTRESDVITRWGGDEFIILMRGNLNKMVVCRKAEEILSVMREPVDIEGKSLNIPTSIGVHLVMDDDADVDANKVIQYADIAMYQAKLKGRDNYQFFETKMAQNANRNFRFEQDLKDDIYSDRFFLVYQPKVEKCGRVIGLEALCRWVHKDDGFISPTDFIPVAEESNLIISLGERVIELVFSQLNTWRSKQLNVVPVSINISGKHLISPDFIPYLVDMLDKYSIPGELVEVEITEWVLVSDINHCIKVLSQLKKLGISISVDDFGTGYSSLNYLKRLPIDVIKIDKSFVDECHTVKEDAKICTAIISLAQNLELSTVAEGVEYSEQLAFLVESGCDLFQGYHFFKPMPAEQIEKSVL
ncbi:ammonium transporter [Vibrio sp. TH_r3]|uniref:ammonium transporter n=1 Tax=Vibrio sp. TH_r3 TaxID=3082084 RepID=UPI002954A4A4|nr:ammonium transporter [Vibrio sp. TH_r3]MDV7104760.1 ammonium transporter [Vibrio sp. TH_r3]